MPHFLAHDLHGRLQIVFGWSVVEEIALLLDGAELRVALIRDQMKQRIPDTLIRNLESRFPFCAAGVIAKFNNVATYGPELHFELIVVELGCIEADVPLPLTEVIPPVVKSGNLVH